MKKVFHIPEWSHGQGSISFKWQNSLGNYLATYGTDQRVKIYDRHGDMISEIHLQGPCVGVDWDKEGDVLSMINSKTGVIFLWDANTLKTNQLDSGLRDPLTFLLWSTMGNLLAVGTAKGNLLIYNHASSKKMPILGKHSKRITCGAWSQQNLLALGSEDRVLSVSNAEGDTLRQTTLRDVPSGIQFSEMKTDERSTSGQNTVSCIIAKKTLFLYNLNDPERPMELAFQPKYGNIVSYKWFGDGYVLIGFSSGYLVVISTHVREIGQEVFQTRDHRDSLTSLAMSPIISKCATVGDSSVKIHDLKDIREITAIINIEEENAVDECAWADDGQLLAVSTPKGALYVFLTRLSMLSATCQTRVLYLTSLLEVTLQDVAGKASPLIQTIEIEPSFLGLGPNHLAIGMNNRAWFYKIDNTKIRTLPHNEEYLETAVSMKMNSRYAAVSFQSKVLIHLIEGDTGDEKRERRMFPDTNTNEKITSFDLTEHFLIYSTMRGKIYFFLLDEWKTVNEFGHVIGVRKIVSNSSGTKVVFLDEKGEAYVYHPVNDTLVPIPNAPHATKGVIWDDADPLHNEFVSFTEEKIYTYILPDSYIPVTESTPSSSLIGTNPNLTTNKTKIEASQCQLVGITKLPHGNSPIILRGGRLTLLTQNGKLADVVLGTHNFLQVMNKLDTLEEADLVTYFDQAVKLCQYEKAWILGTRLNKNDKWHELAKACMRTLDFDHASRVYRHLGDAGMVMSLHRIAGIEDRNLLSGYVAMFLGEYNLAQDFFLASSYPKAALDMRRDLLHWESALQLAKALSPEEMAFISKEYAAQLEFTGDYVNAMLNFERGLTQMAEYADHDRACVYGIARMAIRLGDIKRGVGMAMDSQDVNHQRDCAAILEQIKQFQEGAQLYELSGLYEKAVSLYIRLKMWAKVGQLLPQVSSPKLHLQYAKAMEAEGKFKEATKGYEAARDWDSVIRLNLDHLSDPETAVRIVRETQSIEGAKMVAQFFLKLGDYNSALQFLVMSKCLNEAFHLAQKHGQMEIYADIIGADASVDDYLSMAKHFENINQHYFAGKFYYLAGQYERAMSHFLRAPYAEKNSPALDLAVECAGKANDERLTRQLIDYLLGETDKIPKEPKYLFRLYMALKQFQDAARTAIIIAREEQSMGSYRNAHDLLFEMMQELKQQKIKIPREMGNNLMMLHSYMIAKLHVKRNDHMKAARMLIRVAQNISRFPSHVVPILTSTVIECHRSGLRTSSFSYASMLMRPEYRDKVDAKYRKKLEAIVRRTDKVEEEEPCTACPFCGHLLAETELLCSSCKSNLPYCIATGRHIVKDNFTVCPKCRFPAIYTELLMLLESDEQCPMCYERVHRSEIGRIIDISEYVNTSEFES